jgi:Protein of unknown function (DUF3108)/Tetratricopeptide repeat
MLRPMKSQPIPSLPALFLAALVALSPCDSRAASPSELLEKGIYTEETKGDIDGAIAIYQQIADEAKTLRSLAAQAQLRLGQCYLKKNRTADANAAFEKLVREFPTEKELVAAAKKHLPGELGLGPICWVDGERMTLNISTANGMDIGVVEVRGDLMEADGRKVWRVGRRMSVGGEHLSSVDVDPATFHPVTSYWKDTVFGEVTATFKPGEVQMQRTDKKEPSTVPIDRPVFDNEACFHLFRRLPLAVGYKTTVPVITTIMGGAVMPIGIDVPVKETLEVPAGKFECYKLVLNIGQTMWYSADARRYLVKFEGGGIAGHLTSVVQRKAGEAVPFRNEELGVSFHAPADWVIWKATKGQPEKQVLIRTFDPNGDSTDGGVRLFATDALPEKARKSPRGWAEAEMAKHTEAKVRADSWQNHNIAGRLGVSCVADFVEDGKPQVKWLCYVLGSKWSPFYVISAPPEKFDALRAAFETVVTSYRMTK